jgi:hypothetical protein
MGLGISGHARIGGTGVVAGSPGEHEGAFVKQGVIVYIDAVHGVGRPFNFRYSLPDNHGVGASILSFWSSEPCRKDAGASRSTKSSKHGRQHA